MKVTIELNLENEDDLHKYELIKNARAMLAVLGDIKATLRDVIKYGSNTEHNLTQTSTIDDFDTYFHKILNESCNDIYDLL